MTGAALLLAAIIVGIAGEQLLEEALWRRTISIALSLLGLVFLVAALLLAVAAVAAWRTP